MLDVLDAHALRPQTKTARVFAASTTLSTIVALLRLGDDRIDLVDEHGDDGSATASRARPDRRGWNSTYAPPTSTRGCPSDGSAGLKPSAVYSCGRLLGVGRVRARRGRGRTRRPSAPRRAAHERPRRARARSSRKVSRRAIERPTTRSATCLNAPCSRGPSAREQRQLPAPRVRADERERILPVDDVHPDVARQEIDDRLAVRDPEGDVIQGLGPHSPAYP